MIRRVVMRRATRHTLVRSLLRIPKRPTLASRRNARGRQLAVFCADLYRSFAPGPTAAIAHRMNLFRNLFNVRRDSVKRRCRLFAVTWVFNYLRSGR